MLEDYLKKKPLTLGVNDEELKKLLEQSQIKQPVSWKDQIMAGYNVPEPVQNTSEQPTVPKYDNPVYQMIYETQEEKKKNLEADKQRQSRILMQNKLADVLSGLGTILIGKPQQQPSQGTENAFINYEQSLKNLNALPGEGKGLQLKLAMDKYAQDLQNSYLQQQYGMMGERDVAQFGREKERDEEQFARQQKLYEQQHKQNMELYGVKGENAIEVAKIRAAAAERNAKIRADAAARAIVNKVSPAEERAMHFTLITDPVSNEPVWLNKGQAKEILNRLKNDKAAPEDEIKLMMDAYGDPIPSFQLDEFIQKYGFRYYKKGEIDNPTQGTYKAVPINYSQPTQDNNATVKTKTVLLKKDYPPYKAGDKVTLDANNNILGYAK